MSRKFFLIVFLIIACMMFNIECIFADDLSNVSRNITYNNDYEKCVKVFNHRFDPMNITKYKYNETPDNYSFTIEKNNKEDSIYKELYFNASNPTENSVNHVKCLLNIDNNSVCIYHNGITCGL